MAKQRYINTKFWSDSWISNLDPIEKLLYLYLLTNEHTNISGIYELPVKLMSVETGIEKEMILKIFSRFIKDKKIKYVRGWIIISNFIEHQALNPKIEKGIAIIIQNEIPDDIKIELYKLNPSVEYYEDIYLPESRKKNIRNIIKDSDNCEICKKNFSKENLIVHHKNPLFNGGNNEIENLSIICVECHKEIHNKIGYDSLSKPLNYSNSNSNLDSNSIGDKSQDKPIKKKYTQDGADILKAFELIDPKNKTYYANKTQREACDFLIQEYGKEQVLELIPKLEGTNKRSVYQITTPWEMKEKITKVFNDVKRQSSNNKQTKYYA